MARPVKQTVDYFPHYCSSGRTLFVLQSKFKNDGYAFWFKLLELLGTSEGHLYNYSKPSDWQFLLAKTGVDEDTANSILQTLVELDAIDEKLAQDKIIWVQHFVENIADVYKRRQTSLPQKPSRVAKKTNARWEAMSEQEKQTAIATFGNPETWDEITWIAVTKRLATSQMDDIEREIAREAKEKGIPAWKFPAHKRE